jgi:hypothetical protein
MSNLQADPSRKLLVVPLFGDPDRQHDLEAILAIVPGGCSLPGTGGLTIEPGKALAGAFNFRPLPIWCVAPALKSEFDPGDVIGRALREGLRLAEAENFTKVGIALTDYGSLMVPWGDVIQIAVKTITAIPLAETSLIEIRILVSDSKVMALLQSCLDEQQRENHGKVQTSS